MALTHPIIALQKQLATALNRENKYSNEDLISDRDGEEWMDGQIILTQLPSYRAKPWNHCIPITKLSKDNLPPSFVRLRDDQVGHLSASKRDVITKRELGKRWPWDFDYLGNIKDDRSSWEPRYEGVGGERIVERLEDGNALPLYSPVPLLLTYTSSGKMMAKEIFSTAKKGDWKRKAEDESVKEVPVPKKKARLWTEESVVKAKIEKQKNSGTPKTNGEDEATTELENQLAEERTDFAKHYDDLHSQWLTYTRQKVKQFDIIKAHHATEIHDHNTRNGDLVKRISDLRSRLSDAKDRLDDRGKLLEKVKKRWIEEEQDFFKGKVVDLNALEHENVEHFGDVNLREKRTETDAWDDMDDKKDDTGTDNSTVAAEHTEAAKHAR
ncbi:MAG: hypothetical protein Q9164_007416, partial [Protoblastenia rupestris]